MSSGFTASPIAAGGGKPASLVIIQRAFVDLTYGTEGLAAIRGRTRLLAPPLEPSEALSHPELANAEVIFSGWNAPIMDAEFLRRAPRLRAVFYAAGSVRYFTSGTLWKRNIRVCSAYAINGEMVADYTTGAVLFALKQGFGLARSARSGAFATDLPVPGVYGSKVGVIALGATGRAVARRLLTFGIKVLSYDPFVSREVAESLGTTPADNLEALFREAAVVSLHAPLLPATVGLIRGRHLEAMPRGGTFINTARGAVVNEHEMIQALEKRPDLTAVLDVTHPEPPAAKSPLYALPNAVLTPHVAGAMGLECRRLGMAMIKEFDRWRDGKPLDHEIHPDGLELMA